MAETSNSSQPERRVSSYLLAVIMIAVVVSVFSIYYGALAYLDNDLSNGTVFLALGLATLAIAGYFMFQTRRRMMKTGFEYPKMNTSLECAKCGNKSLREFQKGDYVYKKTEEQCSKCNEKALAINSIFREMKEKEKAKETATYGL